MAQFLTLLPALLLLVAVFNPIVCPSSQMYNERRDRAPYIESSEHSPQYLRDSDGTNGSRLKKAPSYRDNHANYRSQEQFATSQPASYGHQPANTYKDNHANYRSQEQFASSPPASYGHLPANTNEQINKDSIVDKNIRSVFSTDFGPGLYLFKDKIQTSPSNVDNTRIKDSVVHFPTEQPEPEKPVAKRKEPVDTNDCVEKDVATNGKPFCTQLRNYPENSHLEQIIKQRFSNLESFFGEDLVLPQNISQRMNNEPNEEFLCKSRVRVIYPQAGVDREYNWLVIVNIPKYKQGIRIEECINEGSTCGENTGLSLPNNYKATCKQSYIYRSLVAYTSDDTVIKEQFKMPSCCKCVLRTDP